ncbi:hypothetical protein [Polymorphospora lycopeni]|uniref:Lipoprotein n=1 Tax=Polymorphospora lycopeni TaxID=3140240 RepID=A0ABV5D0X7_9ACTN
MRRAAALVTVVLLLGGCGLVREEKVTHTIDYSLTLEGDGALWGIEFHYRDNGNRIEERVSLPAWEHRVVVESPPARVAEVMGQPELREFMRNRPGRPATPRTTCTIHVDGRKVAENTGTIAHCQALVGQ